ncbi:MAG: B12-binding domain-containing radical SAM protein [Candidatus Aminicenantes bacterium]|nr:B12-binding domain-containing radical SAM protein [Candidatus Aminicenantes bacterium]
MNILLVNPYSADAPALAPWPHLGLAILAARAREHGHEVRVVDYAFSPGAPPIDAWLSDFPPDFCGLTLYTAHMKEARKTIREIRTRTSAPIVLGGPHATLNAESLAREHLGDWIFRGESDRLFGEMIPRISPETETRVVTAEPPDLSTVPIPDFGPAFGSETMRTYPVQLSRGCPFSCNFCSVKLLSTRVVRYRDLQVCLDEIAEAVRTRKSLREIRIVDDCPTCRMDNFKTFLRRYRDQRLGLPLHIDNLRADRIDGEMLDLIKDIGVDHLCIGVESGNRAVFDEIHKGETLEDILAAARLIKSKGFRLYTCFVVGLPEATPAAERDSIRLAKSLRPDWIYWNLFQPHKGTAARAWFEAHGRIFAEENTNSLMGLKLTAAAPPCDSPEFPAEERIRVHLTASLETGAYWLNPLYIPGYIRLISSRRLWRSFFAGLPSAVRINSNMLIHKVQAARAARRASRRRAKAFE